MDLPPVACFDAPDRKGRDMTTFKAEDEALGSLILIEELFHALAKSGTVPEAQLADVVRAAVARLDTTDHFAAGAAVRHYFEHWLSE